MLTNGKAWHFFDNHISRPAPEKLATTVDIQKPEAADYLVGLLERSVWESENADEIIATRVAEVADDIRKRTKLSEIAAKLERELAEGFTQNEAGLKKAVQLTLEPNEKELALESFSELSRKLLNVSEKIPTCSDLAAPKVPIDLVDALKSGMELTKPQKRKGTPSDIEAWVGGDAVDVSSWRDVTCGIAEALLALDETAALKSTGLVNSHVNEREKRNGEPYPPHAYRKLSDGRVMFLHFSAADHARRCKKMLRLINAPAQIIRVVFANEEFDLP